MTRDLWPLWRAGAVLAAGWAIVFAAVAFFRPLMPVDETRYLSVAWEMMSQRHWILPLLNFEPYSHKPPMLFWLIRAAWAVGGEGVWPVQVVMFAFFGILAFLTGQIAWRSTGDVRAGAFAMLALGAMPMLLVYSSTIMFDTMLAVWAVSGMLVLWRLARGAQWHLWAAYGLCMGAGILAKGPVALVYMLPVALLAPLWAEKRPWGRWYAGAAFAVAVGGAMALAWAVPAALEGGPAYAQKIFVTQSAGRMVQAFDHREPVWFYVPVILGFIAPLLLWPAIWSGARAVRDETRVDPRARQAVRFVLCWVLPPVLFFSAISSKQIHYMIPVLPGFAVLAGLALEWTGRHARGVMWPLAAMTVPSAIVIGCAAFGIAVPHMVLDGASLEIAVAHIALTAALAAWACRGPAEQDRAAMGMALGAMMMVVVAHAQLGQQFLKRYDLTAVAQAVQPYLDRPLAAAPKYDGEYGYTFRIHHGIESIGTEDMDPWFAKHPDGVVIARFKETDVPVKYPVLYRQAFRNNEVLTLIEAPK